VIGYKKPETERNAKKKKKQHFVSSRSPVFISIYIAYGRGEGEYRWR
jgi:hypothetical protein